MPLHRYTAWPVLFILLQWLAGCSSLSYYTQSIQGQLEIMRKRTPIDNLLAEQKLPAGTLTQLAAVKQIRDFAGTELGLPAQDSYRDYVDTGREFVVWNVFAAPELSLESRQWCYLFIGCLTYRGYFARDDATRFAAELASRGYDIYIGGVAAYSTLGWFADPVLNTMLRHDRVYLARTIFHELAHRKLYIKNDTEFNEAFADTVAAAGTRKWLAAHGTAEEQETRATESLYEEDFVKLVLQYRSRLDAVYKSALTDSEKRRQKQTLLDKMHSDYNQLRSGRGDGDDSYAAWFDGGLNNAKLMAVSIYRAYLPGFGRFLSAAGGDLIVFYGLVEKLRGCTREQRREILLSGKTMFTC